MSTMVRFMLFLPLWHHLLGQCGKLQATQIKGKAAASRLFWRQVMIMLKSELFTVRPDEASLQAKFVISAKCEGRPSQVET